MAGRKNGCGASRLHKGILQSANSRNSNKKSARLLHSTSLAPPDLWLLRKWHWNVNIFHSFQTLEFAGYNWIKKKNFLCSRMKNWAEALLKNKAWNLREIYSLYFRTSFIILSGLKLVLYDWSLSDSSSISKPVDVRFILKNFF